MSTCKLNQGADWTLSRCAGAIEAVVSLMAMRDSKLPPTINYRTPDENL